MDTESKTRYCPYCKEEIKADATKCKHCPSCYKKRGARYFQTD
jgi:hypothetical protein